MSYFDDVTHQLADSPNAVTITDASGSCARGPRHDGEVPVSDGAGLVILQHEVSVTIPTHLLPSLAIDQTVRVTDDEGTVVRYRVRDIRKQADGLIRKVYLVEA